MCNADLMLFLDDNLVLLFAQKVRVSARKTVFLNIRKHLTQMRSYEWLWVRNELQAERSLSHLFDWTC